MMSTHRATHKQQKKMHQSLVIVGLSLQWHNRASATHNIITCECTLICTAVFFLFAYCSIIVVVVVSISSVNVRLIKNYYRNRFVLCTNKKNVVFRSMWRRVPIIVCLHKNIEYTHAQSIQFVSHFRIA